MKSFKNNLEAKRLLNFSTIWSVSMESINSEVVNKSSFVRQNSGDISDWGWCSFSRYWLCCNKSNSYAERCWLFLIRKADLEVILGSLIRILAASSLSSLSLCKDLLPLRPFNSSVVRKASCNAVSPLLEWQFSCRTLRDRTCLQCLLSL